MTTETEGLPELAGRVARLEGAYERVDRQLESLDRRYEGLVHSVDQLRTDMTVQNDRLRAEMAAQIDSVNTRIDSLSKELRITFIAGVTLVIGAVSVATAIIAILIR